MHDVVIRGGEIVDGAGGAPVHGDLAIDGGLISAVREVAAPGRREIDAAGLTVTPGFVDLHTHLDAQIGWDPQLTPVSWHGVTTVLMGNCGVTFAPCRPTDRPLLAGMMETVEDIPSQAILTGLPWDWEDYGGYLDSIERLRPSLNVTGLVGHAAVRFYVMGERAVDAQATEAEKDQMAEVVARSIDAGAVGFSINRYEPHKLPDGRSIPGTFADPDELIRIARVVGERGGLIQSVGAGIDLMKAMAQAGGARVLFSTGVSPERQSGLAVAARVAAVRAEGIDITGLSQPRGSGYIFGLQANLPGRNAWTAIRKLDFAARLAALSDPPTVAALVAEVKAAGPGWLKMEQAYWLGGGSSPDYTQNVSLQAMADAAGEHWAETFIRLSRESAGRALFNYRLFNQNMDALSDLFDSDHVFPGLGDAGAHVSQIMDAGWASFVLSYWVRERGQFSLAEGVRRITSAPARVLGLTDRGVLAPGMRADVNVFDAATVAELRPQLVNDFPGGAPRFIQRARGYRATLVNGEVTVEGGEHTGARAGQVLRKPAVAGARRRLQPAL